MAKGALTVQKYGEGVVMVGYKDRGKDGRIHHRIGPFTDLSDVSVSTAAPVHSPPLSFLAAFPSALTLRLSSASSGFFRLSAGLPSRSRSFSARSGARSRSCSHRSIHKPTRPKNTGTSKAKTQDKQSVNL